MTHTVTQTGRPPAVIAQSECRHCDAVISVELEWWLSQDHEVNRDVWTLETPAELGKRETLCVKHRESFDLMTEKAREYSGDVPPSWFDPTYAGEAW